MVNSDSDESLNSRDSSGRKYKDKKSSSSSKSKKSRHRKDSKDRRERDKYRDKSSSKSSKGYRGEKEGKRRSRSSSSGGSEDSSQHLKSRHDYERSSYKSSRSSRHKRRSHSRERSKKSSYDYRKEYKSSGGSSKKRRSSSSDSSSSSEDERSSFSNRKRQNNARASIKNEPDTPPRNLTSAALLAKIEAKLDLAQQVNRINAIEEIEDEGFVPKSFKTSRAPKPEDIPLPPMELKSINLANLKNEILCHPSLIITQKEREEQWIKRLFAARQKLFAAEGEKISNF